jgi:hypothetical protein
MDKLKLSYTAPKVPDVGPYVVGPHHNGGISL